jgi:hypothetical protein
MMQGCIYIQMCLSHRDGHMDMVTITVIAFYVGTKMELKWLSHFEVCTLLKSRCINSVSK